MGEHVTDKKNMKYQSQEALEFVQLVIDDADKALNDKSRRMEDSPIKEAIGSPTATLSAINSLVGFKGLALFGSLIADGLAALVSPLEESKEILIYKAAVAKQNALIKELRENLDADKKRIEYLTGLIALLGSEIGDLRHDLGIAR